MVKVLQKDGFIIYIGNIKQVKSLLNNFQYDQLIIENIELKNALKIIKELSAKLKEPKIMIIYNDPLINTQKVKEMIEKIGYKPHFEFHIDGLIIKIGYNENPWSVKCNKVDEEIDKNKLNIIVEHKDDAPIIKVSEIR